MCAVIQHISVSYMSADLIVRPFNRLLFEVPSFPQGMYVL